MRSVPRRTFLKGALSALAVAPFVLRKSYRVFAQSTQEYPERVVRLIRESLVIDMLNQFLYRKDQQELKEKWLTQPGAFTEADFRRFQSTGVSVINFGDGADDFADAQQLFAKWNSFIAEYPQWLMRINGSADLAKAKEQGKLGIIFGLQTSGQFQTVDDVNRCFGYGLRVSQLSYNFRSLIADGAFEPYDGGVSEYGGKIIDRMNSVGMAVDLGPRQRQDETGCHRAIQDTRHSVTRQLSRPESKRTPRHYRRRHSQAGRKGRRHGNHRHCIHGQRERTGHRRGCG